MRERVEVWRADVAIHTLRAEVGPAMVVAVDQNDVGLRGSGGAGDENEKRERGESGEGEEPAGGRWFGDWEVWHGREDDESACKQASVFRENAVLSMGR